jgi:hypothetical protein
MHPQYFALAALTAGGTPDALPVTRGSFRRWRALWNLLPGHNTRGAPCTDWSAKALIAGGTHPDEVAPPSDPATPALVRRAPRIQRFSTEYWLLSTDYFFFSLP